MSNKPNNEEGVFTDNFGNWEVRENGELVYNGTAIASPNTFPVADLVSRLNLTHMLGKFQTKDGEDGINFYFAYLKALRVAGYKNLTIDLDHIHNFTIK
ncbi:MAG: hypothetical protein AUK64_2178 [bacterium P201]|nr:MAG: hypothetical protein AUK64_2178 [bacterium P201]